MRRCGPFSCRITFDILPLRRMRSCACARTQQARRYQHELLGLRM